MFNYFNVVFPFVSPPPKSFPCVVFIKFVLYLWIGHLDIIILIRPHAKSNSELFLLMDHLPYQG